MSRLKFSVIAVVILVSACSEKATHDACLISDEQFYLSHERVEQGVNGPNRAGLDDFNKRRVSKFKNRRHSEFAFHYKGNAKKKLQCKSTKLDCSDPNDQHCQSFTCSAVLEAGTAINIIDTPKSEFYRTTEPTYMLWDGQELKCKKA